MSEEIYTDSDGLVNRVEPGEGSTIEIGSDAFTADQLAQLQEWAEIDGWLPEDATGEGEPGEATEQPEFDLHTTHTDLYGQEVRGMDYKFPPPAPGSEAMDLTEQQSVMAAFAAEGIPADLGAEFANVWNKHVSEPVDAEAYELSRAQSVAQLEKVYGDRLDSIVEAAQSEVDRLAVRLPWLQDALKQTTLGHDPWLIGTLANLAEARRAAGG
ncbi:hypothetical protein [Sedimenticola selenatireducens]|uniref:hypothetical protein n=1 Tax=Sedimenticola selenatireducens TaxID=191960 RepID=UPI00048B9BF2|nr:hypothetical protein [Sedimenticola selenatireducens]